MLHHYVEIVVSQQVLHYSHSACLILVLEGHGALDLHQHALFKVRTPMLEVLKLFDE